MKLKILIAVMLVAAMGSGRSDTPPEPANDPAPAAQTPAPEPVPEPEPEVAAEPLRILPAVDAAPEEFLWQARPLVIFADSAEDPAFVQQIKALEDDPDPLIARDVVVITDADPAARTEWRRQLRPKGFSLVLLDKDGQVKLRKPLPWDVREISRAIDKLPLRRQEIGRAGVAP